MGALRSAIPAVLLVLSACGPAEDPAGEPAPGPTPTPAEEPEEPREDEFDPDDVDLGLRVVASGLSSPLYVTDDGVDDDRLFVVEQGGAIRVVEEGEVRDRAFLDIADRVRSGGEQGLLGLAFHPDFPDDPRLYVNYTDANGDTVVAEYRADGDEAGADTERVLLHLDQPFANHNGGALAFGPDGYLFATLGDGGSAGDPQGNGQNPDTLLGTILRLDVEGEGDYAIPTDNPFADGGGAPEVWAYGLRNPWRISFDRDTDDLWIADVGQDGWEEINREPAGRGGGLNYGWNVMEGRECFDPPEGCDQEGLERPVAVYPTGHGCAVIGGFVYRGERFPDLRGGYLFADHCAGTIWGLDAAEPRGSEPAVLLESGHRISSFGQDARGELYVTDLASGELLRVVEG